MNYQLLRMRRPWGVVFLSLLSLLLGQATALQAHVPSLHSSVRSTLAQYQSPVSHGGFQNLGVDYRGGLSAYAHSTAGVDQSTVPSTNAISGSSGGAGEGAE